MLPMSAWNRLSSAGQQQIPEVVVVLLDCTWYLAPCWVVLCFGHVAACIVLKGGRFWNVVPTLRWFHVGLSPNDCHVTLTP